uniref:Uncharacterized protein n=1 Tax=Anguilla anguilla TaxID=7936 RepID=A0A0E9V7I5_ANGAN
MRMSAWLKNMPKYKLALYIYWSKVLTSCFIYK